MKSFVFPGQISQDVLDAGSGQLPYARTQEFANVVLGIERDMLALLGCEQGRMVTYASSGTGAMEALVQNMVKDHDKILVISGGAFGERWISLLNGHSSADVDILRVDSGRDPDYEMIEESLSQKTYQAVFMQHHETSSGQLFDIARVGAHCREKKTLFIVDAIGSFLADPFDMECMGVDAAVISSHKGLCLHPGLAMVVLNKRALETKWKPCEYGYWGFRQNLDSLGRGQPLFSPPVQIYLQWQKRLAMIQEIGLSRLLDCVSEKATSFRAMLYQFGRRYLAQSPSACLTSFEVKVDTQWLCKELAEREIFVMPCSESGKIRVAHLGESTVDDHRELLGYIREIEKKRNHG